MIIIGTGLAGYMTAKEFRKYDTATPLTLITTDDGEFYSKPLLSTALTAHKAAIDLPLANAEIMAKQLNATVLTRSEVTAISPQQQQIEINHKESLNYQKLVLACGAKSTRPTLFEPARKFIYTINNLLDYSQFRSVIKDQQSIAILGAGLIGCEFANDLTNAGYTVTVIEPQAQPLARFAPPEIGQTLAHALREKGAEWCLQRTATKIIEENQIYHITLDDGTSITVDVILSAIGLQPKLSLAQYAGLNVNQGIIVNDYLQTSDPNIYALGDCAEVQGTVRPFIAPLLHSAKALAKTLTGQTTPVTYPIMPIVVKTPACPISLVPPNSNIRGHWEISGTGYNLSALFYDTTRELHGFALSGTCIRQRAEWIKHISV